MLNKNPYKFEYNEKWTIDAKSIFAIILPESYIFSILDITEEQGAIINPHRESYDNKKILYYIIFGEDFRSYILSINGVIEYDQKAFDGKTPSEEAGITVEGDNKWLTLMRNSINYKKTKT